MKNLITKALGIAGITALSFLPMKDLKGQDTLQKISSIKKFYNIGRELDTLQDFATDNYNNANIKFKECVEKEKNDLPCFDILLGYLDSSKNALEKYIFLFEKNRIYENERFRIKSGRDLSISEAQDWLNNEEAIIKYVKDFLDNPNKEKENKWVNYFDYTTKRTNSYFPPEGIIDLSPVLEEE